MYAWKGWPGPIDPDLRRPPGQGTPLSMPSSARPGVNWERDIAAASSYSGIVAEIRNPLRPWRDGGRLELGGAS